MKRNKLDLQKFNIPKPIVWTVLYNNFFDIDPQNIENDVLWNNFTKNLLQIKSQYKDLLLDLGWYPEMNPNGNYCIKLIENNNWEKPLLNIKSQNKNEIVKNIENILEQYKTNIFYKPLPHYNNLNEVRETINSGIIDDIIVLAVAVGVSDLNWKQAQDICVELSKHENENVRGNSAMGLSHIARTERKLEKNVIKPVLLKLLKECTGQNNGKVMDAIRDINWYMKWNIGKMAIKRYEKELEEKINCVRQHST